MAFNMAQAKQLAKTAKPKRMASWVLFIVTNAALAGFWVLRKPLALILLFIGLFLMYRCWDWPK